MFDKIVSFIRVTKKKNQIYFPLHLACCYCTFIKNIYILTYLIALLIFFYNNFNNKKKLYYLISQLTPPLPKRPKLLKSAFFFIILLFFKFLGQTWLLWYLFEKWIHSKSSLWKTILNVKIIFVKHFLTKFFVFNLLMWLFFAILILLKNRV